MNRRRRLVIIVSAGAILVTAATIALTGTLNRPDETSVAVTVPVALQADGLPKNFSIGIVLTLGQSGEPGSEYNRAAQGAVVATQRFAQGGAAVTLLAQNDSGSVDGARAAVETLADQGVAGVIVTSTGPQAQAASTASRWGVARSLW